MNIHDGCPHCAAAAEKLHQHGPEVHGQRWYICASCQHPILVRASDGDVTRIGKP